MFTYILADEITTNGDLFTNDVTTEEQSEPLKKVKLEVRRSHCYTLLSHNVRVRIISRPKLAIIWSPNVNDLLPPIVSHTTRLVPSNNLLRPSFQSLIYIRHLHVYKTLILIFCIMLIYHGGIYRGPLPPPKNEIKEISMCFLAFLIAPLG